MKNLFTQATVGLLVSGAIFSAIAGGPEAPPTVVPGIYFGIGGAWDAYYMKRGDVAQAVRNSDDYAGNDVSRNDTNSKFAPLVQVGFWAPIDSEWLWGLQVTYKYLNYTVNDYSSARYYNLSHYSSVFDRNAFNNELLLLGYFGMQFVKGYAYLGLGAVMFTARTMLASAQAPINGTNYNAYIDWQKFNRSIWGGAFQVGYNYYFKPTWFLGLNYTYALSGSYTDTGVVDGADIVPNPTQFQTGIITASRKIQLEAHEFMFSINKVFWP